MTKANDIFEQLKSEHQIVNDLIEKLAACEPEDRNAVLEEIEENLVPHARAEEKTLYAAIAQEENNESDEASIIADAYEEHSEVDGLLADMMELNAVDGAWEEKINTLRDSIKHHVKEEETEIFTKAKEMFNAEVLDGLHEAYQKAKADFEELLPTQDQINAKEISSEAASALHQ